MATPPGGDRAVVLALWAVGFAWGGSYPALKAIQPLVPPVAFAAFRTTVAALSLLGLGLLGGGLPVRPRGRDWWAVIALGLAGNTVFQLALVVGIHHTTPAHAALLVSLNPVFAAILARLCLGEPIGSRRAGGIGLAFAGVAVIVTRGATDLTAGGPWGDLLSAAAGLAWAAYSVFARPLLRRYPALDLTTWGLVAGALPLLLLGLPELVSVRWTEFSPADWLLCLYLSVGSIGLANALWYWALARTATARAATFTYLNPVVATAIAVVAGQEMPTVDLAAGAALVLAGIAIAQRA